MLFIFVFLEASANALVPQKGRIAVLAPGRSLHCDPVFFAYVISYASNSWDGADEQMVNFVLEARSRQARLKSTHYGAAR